jgi:hypothetical protein
LSAFALQRNPFLADVISFTGVSRVVSRGSDPEEEAR